MIIAENGKTAVNFEHAWGDGVAVLRCCARKEMEGVGEVVIRREE